MGSSSPASIPPAEDAKQNLFKQIRSHEVALGELNSLPSSRVHESEGFIVKRFLSGNRPTLEILAETCILDAKYIDMAVYQKHGSIFFRTTIKGAMASEQKQADLGKAQLQELIS